MIKNKEGLEMEASAEFTNRFLLTDTVSLSLSLSLSLFLCRYISFSPLPPPRPLYPLFVFSVAACGKAAHFSQRTGAAGSTKFCFTFP